MDWIIILGTIVNVIVIVFGLNDIIILRLEVPNRMKNRIYKEKNYSSARIEKETKRIEEKVRKSNFRPTKIIGLGTGTYVGGIIIGANLASRNNLDIEFISLAFNQSNYQPEYNSFQSLEKQVSFKKDNLLLVDDISQRGVTISNAIKSLKKLGFNEKNVKVAVIVRYDNSLIRKQFSINQLPLDEYFWENNFYNHVSKTSRIQFPWKYTN